VRALGFSAPFAFVLGVAACSSAPGPSVLSYDEFKAQAHHDSETDSYVVNGDELVEGDQAMRDAYDAYVDSANRASDAEQGIATVDQDLIVNRVSSRDDKWAAATAANLTFCVSQSSFGSRYTAVVNAMSSATATWEATARVNFVHATASDANCTRSTTGVVFNVRQVTGGAFLARSFFPSSTRANREVQIDSTSFGSISPYTLAGILRHELGHTLGFRHEHTRPEAGTCFEDNSWRALTTYDSASVMHYPQCNGSNRGDLALTARDKTGARALYP
jgi:serralysin